MTTALTSTPTETPPRFRFSLLFLTWLVAILTTVIITLILPSSFCSWARIQVLGSQVSGGRTEPKPTAAYDPGFVNTECQVLNSQVILGRVVEMLDLNHEWGKKYAGGQRLRTTDSIAIIRARLSLSVAPGTNLIAIGCYSEDATEAARLANALADAYRDYRIAKRLQNSAGRIEWLSEYYQKNQERLRKTQEQLESLKRGTNPPSFNPVGELKAEIDRIQFFGQTLQEKLESEKLDQLTSANQDPVILDRAVPANRPYFPNRPLNLVVGIVVGGILAAAFAMLVYLLQRRAFRRKSGGEGGVGLTQARLILHALIGLVVGVSFGYLIAMPLRLGSVLSLPLPLILGAVACAVVELSPLIPSFLSPDTKPRGRRRIVKPADRE